MGRLKSLNVDKISLLTSEHQPAVPKAGIGFSILKFFTRKKVEKVNIEKLQAASENLKKFMDAGTATITDVAEASTEVAKSFVFIIEKMKKIYEREER